jgi:hypothetical protein
MCRLLTNAFIKNLPDSSIKNTPYNRFQHNRHFAIPAPSRFHCLFVQKRKENRDIFFAN